jgi:hypothetical protein
MIATYWSLKNFKKCMITNYVYAIGKEMKPCFSYGVLCDAEAKSTSSLQYGWVSLLAKEVEEWKVLVSRSRGLTLLMVMSYSSECAKQSCEAVVAVLL